MNVPEKILLCTLLLSLATTCLSRLKRTENSQCPTGCVCSKYLNAQHVNCSSQKISSIPSDISPRTSLLNLESNEIEKISNYAFQSLKELIFLSLKHNKIKQVEPNAFEGLASLKVLEMNGNQLSELPQALRSLPQLEELIFSNNKIHFLPNSSFQFNSLLANLELSGNPITAVDKDALSRLSHLKKLILSETRLLEEFPEIKGPSSLQHLRIDRAKLSSVPDDLCHHVPSLRSLNLKSNKLTTLPELRGCKELRLVDLSYNLITEIEDNAFSDQGNLIDLFLAHNSLSRITQDTFKGLTNLHVLDLENNEIETIHLDAFVHLKELRDLNLGENKFPKLPTKGLQNLRHLKTFNNKELKDFPPKGTFPRISHLVLSYAYHCCAFMSSIQENPSLRPGLSVKETIVWLSKEDIDFSHWNANLTHHHPSSGNLSKFEEFANQLWKSSSKNYTVPDNLAHYPEEYLEELNSSLLKEENHFAQFSLQCLPEPGPFMPCEDLFGWWSLRCGIWVVFLLAFLGNGTVVIVLLIRHKKMDVPRFLVCNLASADFFMSLYLGILAVVDATTLGEFKVSAIKWQTSAGCQIAGFLGVLSSELSVFTLSVITSERNYAITNAVHLNKRLSLKHASYIMLVGWIFAVIMASLPLIGFSDYKKFAICLPFETEDAWSLSYVLFLILFNGLAFLILMGCYLKMYCAIRGSSAWNSNDSRIARRMALLVFTDFLCYAPIAFFSLTAVFGFHLISLEEAKVFAIFVLPLNSCANPFLYAIFTKQFKKDCIYICKRIEESRITRGIGRRSHSSNFSNKHSPIAMNSEPFDAFRDSEDLRSSNPSSEVCRCGKNLWIPKKRRSFGWSALKYIFCRRKLTDNFQSEGYSYSIAEIQRSLEKANKHSTSSSEVFSFSSDSWKLHK